VPSATIFTVDFVASRYAVADATARFCDLLQSAPDPTLLVRGSAWTVADVGAHVATVADSYVGYLDGTVAPVVHVHSLNRDNAANLAAFDERAVTALSARIRDGSAAFLDSTSELSVDHPMRWHDVPATIGTVYGIYLGELLVHGRDIARTLGRSWQISRTDAIIIFEGMVSVARWFVEPTRASDGEFEINVRRGPSYTFRFLAGSLDIEPDRAGRPDCRIWADPRALTLVLYGRLSQWHAILRGQLIAGGRRPWRALTFTARFGGF
jgi:uncharacterized protein (TIGR03083 family)